MVLISSNFVFLQNKLLGLKGDIIHPFNKNHTSIGNSDYFDSLKCWDNIILLGDSLGDVDMTEGMKNINVILKIGFLNYRVRFYYFFKIIYVNIY